MANSSEANTFSMQELFQKDLRTQLKQLNDVLEIPQEGAFSEYVKTLCRALIRFTRSLKGPALLMDYTTFVALIDALDSVSSSFLRAFLKEPTQHFTQFELLVRDLTDVFKQIVEVPPSLLTQTIKESQDTLQSATHALKRFAEIKEVGEEKVEAVEKDPEKGDKTPVTKLSSADPTLLTLFFVDLETYTSLLQEGLLALELEPLDEQMLASLMRAAHSIKGAARVIGLEPIVHLAHALEECFLLVQNKRLSVEADVTNRFFETLDLFRELLKKQPEEINQWLDQRYSAIRELTNVLNQLLTINEAEGVKEERSSLTKEPSLPITPLVEPRSKRERTLRMTAAYLNRLMGFAGELLVESRSLQPISEDLLQLKKIQYEQSTLLDDLRASYNEQAFGEEGEKKLIELQRKTNACRSSLADLLEQLEEFMRRHGSLSDYLYREIVSSRLCTFDDGVEELPRIVRDLGRYLHKQVRLEIIGRSVTVDRDILDKLQTPLQHLLRNAVDHGIELPARRIALGKNATGTIRLEAYHHAGSFNIVVADDGCGIDLERLRRVLVDKKFIDPNKANQMKQEALLAFLFMPGITTSMQTTEISGRGFGLNTVQTMVHEVGGQIRVESTEGQGTRFSLQLPLTLSIVNSLLVNIAGEPYAIPLARSHRVVTVEPDKMKHVENRFYMELDGQDIGLVWGHQLLGLPGLQEEKNALPVVILKGQQNVYGVIVDALIGEEELIVQELDPHLGKVPLISCGAFMEDGSPVLVMDVEEILAQSEEVPSENRVMVEETKGAPMPKRILVVDDSASVREVESRILEAAGFVVDVADDGSNAWNIARAEEYDLIVTDMNMPNMDGLGFIKMLKGSFKHQNIPIMIVSYKEDPEDIALGLEAGANEYLTKSQFCEDLFLMKVNALLTGNSKC